MPVDYPAAHSMDSYWFAVDEAGHLAVFDTGEGGALPVSGFPMGGEAGGDPKAVGLEEPDLAAAVLLWWAQRDEEIAALLPEDPDEAREVIAEAWWESEDEGRLFAALGVYRFFCDESWASPYTLGARVPQPLGLDALPEAMRASLADAVLPVTFSEIQGLAPGEYVDVDAWGPVWLDTQGKAHPTASGTPDASDLAEIEELGAPVEGHEFTLPEPMSRDELLEELARMVVAGRQHVERARAQSSRRPPPPTADDEGTEGSPSSTGLIGWLSRLFGGRS